jgi:hypothetical protein
LGNLGGGHFLSLVIAVKIIKLEGLLVFCWDEIPELVLG